jgi:anionic cell wall polymer biosynthesis LytR-Cps2A-Psr (LCP) family protein
MEYMDKRSRPTIDGFVPRRSAGGIDSFPGRHTGSGSISGLQRHVEPTEQVAARRQHTPQQALTPVESAEPRRQIVSRADVDDSLHEIDEEPVQQPHHRRGHVRNKGAKPTWRKILKRVVLALIILGILLVGWIGVKAFLAGKQVFKGDIFGIIQQKELKSDENGRSNILVLGTSEDDHGHDAGWLTDSIMIVSIDQKNKNAYMISIPRDLEVKYGMACTAGYSGKINGYFNCVNDDWESTEAEDERQTASRKFFGDIVGLDIQYSVHVNYTVMRDIVKAIDGITITIESPDPRGQMDGNFDWKCGATYAERMKNCPPRGHFIDYPNGPVTLDAEHALYLAQARGDTEVNWGFPNSNFDRERNQQKILVAIKEKALSTGTLTNVSKVTGLIDALGNNLRTNFETSEVRTLMTLGTDIPATSIISIDLLKGGVVNGSAQPTAGAYEFSGVQAYIRKTINATPVSREAAHVVVWNASGVSGAAQAEADKLEALGLVVDGVDNAPDGMTFSGNTFYYTGSEKPKTLTALQGRYGKGALATAKPEFDVTDTTDFVVIITDPLTTAGE